MRYYRPYVFNGSLVKSSVKLGKAANVEERCIDVYIKGMVALKQRYFFYKRVIAGKIEYYPEMRTKSTYKNRAVVALRACHFRARRIKEDFNRLVLVNEVPKKYPFCIFESIENSIVSDCEMLGFCICDKHNVPPYIYGCMEKGRDILMLDVAEEENMRDEAITATSKLISSIVTRGRK